MLGWKYRKEGWGRVWGPRMEDPRRGRAPPRTVIERQPNCFMSIDKVNHFPFSHFCLQIIRFVLFTRGFSSESFVLWLFVCINVCIKVCICTSVWPSLYLMTRSLCLKPKRRAKAKKQGKIASESEPQLTRVGIGMCTYTT